MPEEAQPEEVRKSVKLIAGLTPLEYQHRWRTAHLMSHNAGKRRRYAANAPAERQRNRVYYHAHKNELNERDREQRFRFRRKRFLDNGMPEEGIFTVSRDWLQNATFIIESPGRERMVESLRDPLPTW